MSAIIACFSKYVSLCALLNLQQNVSAISFQHELSDTVAETAFSQHHCQGVNHDEDMHRFPFANNRDDWEEISLAEVIGGVKSNTHPQGDFDDVEVDIKNRRRAHQEEHINEVFQQEQVKDLLYEALRLIRETNPDIDVIQKLEDWFAKAEHTSQEINAKNHTFFQISPRDLLQHEESVTHPQYSVVKQKCVGILPYAAAHDRTETVKFLLKHGAAESEQDAFHFQNLQKFKRKFFGGGMTLGPETPADWAIFSKQMEHVLETNGGLLQSIHQKDLHKQNQHPDIERITEEEAQKHFATIAAASHFPSECYRFIQQKLQKMKKLFQEQPESAHSCTIAS